VQTAIGDPLARMLIAGQVLDGQHVVVDSEPSGEVGRGGLVLRVTD
jgi:ATP-dependent Clp protease ATP-binding subunit ClpB